MMQMGIQRAGKRFSRLPGSAIMIVKVVSGATLCQIFSIFVLLPPKRFDL